MALTDTTVRFHTNSSRPTELVTSQRELNEALELLYPNPTQQLADYLALFVRSRRTDTAPWGYDHMLDLYYQITD